MIVESLELVNFRNYESLKITFDAGTNIFYGDNAQGKTNILEAVYMSGTSRSHRGCHDRDMIRFGEEESHIRTVLRKNGDSRRVDIHLKKNKNKGIAVDGVPLRKAGDLFGVSAFIVFSPEDLNIIKQGPAQRRRFLDMELCQLDRVYYRKLWEYNRILAQRNQLLKDLSFTPGLMDTLDVWDAQLAKSGAVIIGERDRFVKELNKIIKGIHSKLTGGREDLNIAYESNVAADEIYEKIKAARERDLKMKTSTTGPHRDDLYFEAGGMDIRKFGSQGQQRTAALSLKLSEIELVKSSFEDDPVLLLDDVLSELDQNRQNYLLESINDIQTMITCTGLDEFVNNRFSINKVFFVSEGKVAEKI